MVDSELYTILPDGVRVSPTGAKRSSGKGKGRYDLLPPEALQAWASRMEDGVEKYGARNCEKGLPLTSYLDSAMRHLVQLMAGYEDEDHAAAILFNIGFYIATNERINSGELPEFLREGLRSHSRARSHDAATAEKKGGAVDNFRQSRD